MKSFIVDRLGFDDRDIRMLLDSEATRDNVLASIEEWLIEGTKPGDEAFLFFSGHGYQQPDTDRDEADRLDETLVPVDVIVNEDDTIEGMITDDEMAVLLGRLTGRRVHVMVDACHSGTSNRLAVVDEGWRYVKTPRRLDGRPIRIPAAASGADAAAVAAVPASPESFVSAKSLDLSHVDLTVWTAVKAE